MKTLLILVSGLPCTGKTTLAKEISQSLSLPLISRDAIKETLFNSLGSKNREWSKKLGSASYDLLYDFAETLLGTGQSIVVESNFQPKFANSKFRALKNKYSFDWFQVYLLADSETLLQRFKVRAESGERHPGHIDHLNYEEFKNTLNNSGYEPSEGCDRLFQLVTTDFATIDYQSLLKEFKLAISNPDQMLPHKCKVL